jgi:hypothetical protein
MTEFSKELRAAISNAAVNFFLITEIIFRLASMPNWRPILTLFRHNNCIDPLLQMPQLRAKLMTSALFQNFRLTNAITTQGSCVD